VEGVDDGRLGRVGGWSEWEERYSRGASIPTDLCLFLFSTPLLSVEIMQGQEIHGIDWILRPSFMAAFSQ